MRVRELAETGRSLGQQMAVGHCDVAVEADDEFASRLADAAVAGDGRAAVGFIHKQADLRELPADRLGAVIGRAVIHHDHLEVHAFLPEHIGKQREHAVAAVVAGNDDADHGGGHGREVGWNTHQPAAGRVAG